MVIYLLHRFNHHNNIKHKTILFTDSALWAGSVIELPCASACVFVCVSVPSQDTHFRRLERSSCQRAYCYFWPVLTHFFFLLPFFRFNDSFLLLFFSCWIFWVFLVNQSTAGLTCTVLENWNALHCTDRWQVRTSTLAYFGKTTISEFIYAQPISKGFLDRSLMS